MNVYYAYPSQAMLDLNTGHFRAPVAGLYEIGGCSVVETSDWSYLVLRASESPPEINSYTDLPAGKDKWLAKCITSTFLLKKDDPVIFTANGAKGLKIGGPNHLFYDKTAMRLRETKFWGKLLASQQRLDRASGMVPVIAPSI